MWHMLSCDLYCLWLPKARQNKGRAGYLLGDSRRPTKESQLGGCHQRTETAPENLDSSLGEFPSIKLIYSFIALYGSFSAMY